MLSQAVHLFCCQAGCQCLAVEALPSLEAQHLSLLVLSVGGVAAPELPSVAVQGAEGSVAVTCIVESARTSDSVAILLALLQPN